MFTIMHKSVAEYSIKMMMEMKRHNYVTPTNYLELVAGYKKYVFFVAFLSCIIFFFIDGFTSVFILWRSFLSVGFFFCLSVLFHSSVLDPYSLLCLLKGHKFVFIKHIFQFCHDFLLSVLLIFFSVILNHSPFFS